MTDERLAERLRAALPPTEDAAVRRDLWPSLVERLAQRPRWSLLDLALGAAAAVALAAFPEWLWMLVYHL